MFHCREENLQMAAFRTVEKSIKGKHASCVQKWLSTIQHNIMEHCLDNYISHWLFFLHLIIMIANGLSIVGWRDVPVDESVLGVLSKDFVPTIRQVYRIMSYAIKMTYLSIYLSTKSAWMSASFSVTSRTVLTFYWKVGKKVTICSLTMPICCTVLF